MSPRVHSTDGYTATRDTGSWFVEVASGENHQDVRLFPYATEPKTAKNRMHLDLHLGADDRDAEVARLIGLGATKLWDAQQGGHKWDTLADPEGNEFCVA